MKTLQLLSIVLTALLLQLPSQTHGSQDRSRRYTNEVITQLLQEMIEEDKLKADRQLENMLESQNMHEDNILEATELQVNMMESQPASRFNLKIDGCEGMSSLISKSLGILLKPLGGEITVSCPKKPASVGLTYTRWGSSSCPTGVEKLYTGRISSSAYNEVGGANYLCLPEQPDTGDLDLNQPWLSTGNRIGRLFETKYEYPKHPGGYNQNAVCTVCYVPKRSAQVMIPAQASCPAGWTREYYGYLMGETKNARHTSSEYICVDKAQDYVSEVNTSGALLYHIAVSCNGFDCPPYSIDKVLACSVCSK